MAATPAPALESTAMPHTRHTITWMVAAPGAKVAATPWAAA
jgi:hypothetical protein